MFNFVSNVVIRAISMHGYTTGFDVEYLIVS